MNDFVLVRERTVKHILTPLREDQATGPDGIPAPFWKRLAKVFCRPFTMLTRRMLQEAAWPEKLRLHNIVTIYKKGATHSPSNFRGAHLTTVASKVVERSILSQVKLFLQSNSFRTNQ